MPSYISVHHATKPEEVSPLVVPYWLLPLAASPVTPPNVTTRFAAQSFAIAAVRATVRVPAVPICVHVAPLYE